MRKLFNEMKKRRAFKQSSKLRQKQKLTWYFIAAGVAIAVFVGIGVFFYLNLGVDTDSLAAGGQGYTSQDGYAGAWEDNPSWTKSKTWMNDNPGNNVNTGYVDVYGIITRTGDLTVGGSTDLSVYDTLWVTGNLNITGGAKLIIDGVLIVGGNFVIDGGINTTNDGKVVVLGDLNASGGAKLNNYNDFYVFGDLNASGGTRFNGSQNNPSNSNIGGDEDLAANDGSLYSFAMGGGGVLPVEFHYVKAEKNGNTVEIKWATATELNNDFFTIEKSQDGKNFEAIGTVAGAGNSNTLLTYQFTDTKLQSGTQYYRVKQTDFDGQFDYSNIVSVSNASQSEDSNNQISILTVGPNPFTDMFNVDFDLSLAGPVEVSLMNMNGSVVVSETIEGYAGNNRYAFNDNRGLENGIYILRLTQHNITSKAIRLMKR